jgi:hypothetical protein
MGIRRSPVERLARSIGALLSDSGSVHRERADSVAARCNIMRPLVREKPISDEWVDAFGVMLAQIEALAKSRNRMVHDRWELAGGSVIRVDRRAFTKRPQSRQPVSVEFDTEHVTQPGEVDELTAKVGRMAFLVHCALRDLEDWLQQGLQVSPPLLIRAHDLPQIPDVLQLIARDASLPRQPSRR